MDVVERVHEEVRVDLVLQVVHLGLQVLPLERLHLLFVAHRLVDELDAGVGSGHEEAEDDVPVDLEVRERGLAVGIDRLRVVLRADVEHEVLLVELDEPEDSDDERQVEQHVFAVFAAEHVPRGEDAVVDQEDDQVGRDLLPGDEYVLEVDVHLGHHLRVEHRHEDDGRPDHQVEQVFAYGLFALYLHGTENGGGGSGVDAIPDLPPRVLIRGVSCRAARRCRGNA